MKRSRPDRFPLARAATWQPGTRPRAAYSIMAVLILLYAFSLHACQQRNRALRSFSPAACTTAGTASMTSSSTSDATLRASCPHLLLLQGLVAMNIFGWEDVDGRATRQRDQRSRPDDPKGGIDAHGQLRRCACCLEEGSRVCQTDEAARQLAKGDMEQSGGAKGSHAAP